MSQMNYMNLEHLCDTLNQMHSQVSGDMHFSQAMGILFLIERTLENAQTFGGQPPKDTAGIWSWDETRYLVAATNGGFELCSRDEYDA